MEPIREKQEEGGSWKHTAIDDPSSLTGKISLDLRLLWMGLKSHQFEVSSPDVSVMNLKRQIMERFSMMKPLRLIANETELKDDCEIGSYNLSENVPVFCCVVAEPFKNTHVQPESDSESEESEFEWEDEEWERLKLFGEDEQETNPNLRVSGGISLKKSSGLIKKESPLDTQNPLAHSWDNIARDGPPVGPSVPIPNNNNNNNNTDSSTQKTETQSSATTDTQSSVTPDTQSSVTPDTQSSVTTDTQSSVATDTQSTTTATPTQATPAATAPAKKPKKKKYSSQLRAPIVCVLGHVDTGKTSLLDYMRRTFVQASEAGGITQQIGATFFPVDALQKQTEKVNSKHKFQFDITGLLLIDTPGHESFTNLRSRGNSLCDLSVLVVDIMHGLEPQTIESLGLLRKRRTPFIIALNKIDRLNGWVSEKHTPIKEALKRQSPETLEEFRKRLEMIQWNLEERGFKTELYYKNKDFRKYISICPTSAVTGEGISDLQLLLVLIAQNYLYRRLAQQKQLQCSVLEVKVNPNFGTSIDVLLVNGEIKRGDRIVLAGLNGAISTTVRSLLTPKPMNETRVKGDYLDQEVVSAVTGLRIAAKGLEEALAGSSLFVVDALNKEKDLQDRVTKDVKKIVGRLGRTGGAGVCVNASTLGSLEALLEFFKESDIPVCHASIGPVTKKDVTTASGMYGQYRVVLAFDVQVQKQAEKHAINTNVTIFTAKIIYHLFDYFSSHSTKYGQKVGKKLVEPLILQIIPEYVANTANPLVVGCYVRGTVAVGQILVIPDLKFLEIGRVSAIRTLTDPTPVDRLNSGEIAILKIVPDPEKKGKMALYGRDFDFSFKIFSKLDEATQLSEASRTGKDDYLKEYRKTWGIKEPKEKDKNNNNRRH